jgi:anaerobic selenocysteine-containing dehydrogenase
MPEKIKEIRVKNEETFKYSDESFNQMGNIHLMGGNMGVPGAGQTSYYHNNPNYTNHQSLYHHRIQAGLSSVENQNHDFEDFLNLVTFKAYFVFHIKI